MLAAAAAIISSAPQPASPVAVAYSDMPVATSAVHPATIHTTDLTPHATRIEPITNSGMSSHATRIGSSLPRVRERMLSLKNTPNHQAAPASACTAKYSRPALESRRCGKGMARV